MEVHFYYDIYSLQEEAFPIYYTHDDYLELQKECVCIINKIFNNIVWNEKEEE